MLRNYRYRDRESGINYSDFQPSKMKLVLDNLEVFPFYFQHSVLGIWNRSNEAEIRDFSNVLGHIYQLSSTVGSIFWTGKVFVRDGCPGWLVRGTLFR